MVIYFASPKEPSVLGICTFCIQSGVMEFKTKPKFCDPSITVISPPERIVEHFTLLFDERIIVLLRFLA